MPNIAVVCLWVASNKTNPKFFTTETSTRKIPTEPEQFVAFGVVVVAGVTAVVVAVVLLLAAVL